MQDTKSKPPERFFFRQKWLLIVYGVVVVSSALLAPMNLRFGDILHRIQAGVQFVMAVTFGWLGWYWWRTWKHPLVTVSDEVIEWGPPTENTSSCKMCWNSFPPLGHPQHR